MLKSSEVTFKAETLILTMPIWSLNLQQLY